ncbi:MAG: hypothetical protein KZQ91_09965 [Candidatus Thiodiazotropha sp. (ex Lucinoma borealis)]|nr:hypothetical protein [Candidatus Thiodiazotropha sp. (ex Lucinoma borealis)]
MFPLIRPIFVCAFMVLFNAASFAANVLIPENNPLDGSQFHGLTGELGKGDHHKDTITFKNGQFRSLDCEDLGFEPAPYSVKKIGDSYHFTSTLLSTDRGKLEWEGSILGDNAEAKFRWLHKRWYWNIDRQYWFRGKRESGL